MSTGSFENWTGDITQIGPLYPFVGSEMLMFIICVAFWLYWHFAQWRMEDQNIEKDLKALKESDTMDRALKGEKVLQSM